MINNGVDAIKFTIYFTKIEYQGLALYPLARTVAKILRETIDSSGCI